MLELHRLGLVNAGSQVRISFAYLFRIKIHDKYMLVRNEHRPSVYQPVGGAYQYFPSEAKFLVGHYQIRNDDGQIPDISKPGDYRMFVPGVYLKSFLQRFDQTSARESVLDLSREFVEEIINADILPFSTIKYRYCGRHISEIHFSDYFQCYELLLADIVELLPDHKQYRILSQYINLTSPSFRFVTSKEIEDSRIMGQSFTDKFIIADHSYKILCENESTLINVLSLSDIHEVSLKNSHNNR